MQDAVTSTAAPAVASSTSPPAAVPGRPLLVAFVTIFLDLLGFGLIIPIQAFYAESLGATFATVTLLGASYSLMQFLFAPFWGRLSDRVGRRPIVLVSVAISCMGQLVFGFAGSLPLLFVSRMLIGFGNANIGTAQAIVSDVTTPETRAKGMGIIGAAFGLGFIFGPAIGGALGQYSMHAPPFASAALALVNLTLAYFFLPETRQLGAEKPAHLRRDILSLTALRGSLRFANVGPLLLIAFVVTIGFAMMEQTSGLLLEWTWLHDSGLTGEARVKAAAKLTAYFLVAVGITATVVQGGLIGRLQKRFGEVTLVRAGAVLLALAMVLVPTLVGAQTLPLMMLASSLLAVGSGLLNPSASSLLSRSVPADEQGSILGLAQSMSALGRVIGPSLAGVAFQTAHGLPFYAAAGLIGVGAVVTTKLSRPAV